MRWNYNSFASTIYNHIISYPTPINLNYFYGFGSLAGIMLVIQILTGVFLAMHYTPHIDLAFSSVEHIMRDVNYGWLLRYTHANGASFFFIIVYIHIFRGLYYGSYQKLRDLLWCPGVLIFIAMMATAFMGYVLPWGQMSFWGATVITNLFSAIPFVGKNIVDWLWGGFSVDNPTLNRFFSLHFLLPFIIAALSFLYLILLYQHGFIKELVIVRFYSYCCIKLKSFFYSSFFKNFFCFFLIRFIIFLFFNLNKSCDCLPETDVYVSTSPLTTKQYFKLCDMELNKAVSSLRLLDNSLQLNLSNKIEKIECLSSQSQDLSHKFVHLKGKLQKINEILHISSLSLEQNQHIHFNPKNTFINQEIFFCKKNLLDLNQRIVRRLESNPLVDSSYWSLNHPFIIHASSNLFEKKSDILTLQKGGYFFIKDVYSLSTNQNIVRNLVDLHTVSRLSLDLLESAHSKEYF